MKTSTFTEEQTVQILREAETGEQTIGSVCRAHGIAENTFYKGREVQTAKGDERPFVDAQRVVGRVLERLSGRHTVHRQFSERFPDLHREQVLGMQLYTLMLADNDTWIYAETQHAGHLFPHATYFTPES